MEFVLITCISWEPSGSCADHMDVVWITWLSWELPESCANPLGLMWITRKVLLDEVSGVSECSHAAQSFRGLGIPLPPCLPGIPAALPCANSQPSDIPPVLKLFFLWPQLMMLRTCSWFCAQGSS